MNILLNTIISTIATVGIYFVFFYTLALVSLENSIILAGLFFIRILANTLIEYQARKEISRLLKEYEGETNEKL